MERQSGKKPKLIGEELLQKSNEISEELPIPKEEAADQVIVPEVVEHEFAPHEDVTPDPVKTESKKLGKKTGIISNCNALRLRGGANIKTNVLAVIPVNTKIEIDLDNSTESFYEVTYTGLIGFCLKQFVRLE